MNYIEELIDVLDDTGKKTGEVKTKTEIKRDGNYHRAISICFINSNYEILIQKRSEYKKVYPKLWSIFLKGHVRSNETSVDACIRETKEELGIDISLADLKFLYTMKEEKINGDYIENIFYDTFLVKKDFLIKDMTLEKEEVSNVKYVSQKNIKEALSYDINNFVPNENDYKKIFKLIKKN